MKTQFIHNFFNTKSNTIFNDSWAFLKKDKCYLLSVRLGTSAIINKDQFNSILAQNISVELECKLKKEVLWGIYLKR